jgi:hypothetical protein
LETYTQERLLSQQCYGFVQVALKCFETTVSPLPSSVVTTAARVFHALCLLSPASFPQLFRSSAFQWICGNTSKAFGGLSMDDQITCVATVAVLMYASIPSTVPCDISDANRQLAALQCMTPSIRAIVDVAASESVLPHVRVLSSRPPRFDVRHSISCSSVLQDFMRIQRASELLSGVAARIRSCPTPVKAGVHSALKVRWTRFLGGPVPKLATSLPACCCYLRFVFLLRCRC